MALLFLIPLCIIMLFGLAGYGFGSLGRVGIGQASRALRLRSGAASLGAITVALYTWGLLHLAGAVIGADGTGASGSPRPSCRTADQDLWSTVVDSRVDYLPLRFVCETSDGGSYVPDIVPGYIGPAAAAFGLSATVCAAAAAVESERRARRSGG
ncbi:hypothetical protein ACH4LZ_25585 [Streptomyces halstedii]|uniref:hypothetical protein n=1 Tax=Streptomyces halstedii TaxID=1944 RepID=UPI0037B4F72D